MSCLSYSGACVLGIALAAALPVHASDRVLVYGADASPEGFDPALWDSTATRNATTQIFPGLIGFKRGTSTVAPGLATAWTVSPNATTFTFGLRPGVKFQATAAFKPTHSAEYAPQLLRPGRANAVNDQPVGTEPYMLKSCRKDGDLQARTALDHDGTFLRLHPVCNDVQGFLTPNGSVDFEAVSRT